MDQASRHERYALGAQTLAQLAHLLMIVTVARQSEKLAPSLVEELEKYLAQGVNAAELLTAKVVDSSTNETSLATSVVARQLHVALEEKNYEGFLQAFDVLLDGLNINPADLSKEIEDLRNNAVGLYKMTRAENKERSLTGVINVV